MLFDTCTKCIYLLYFFYKHFKNLKVIKIPEDISSLSPYLLCTYYYPRLFVCVLGESDRERQKEGENSCFGVLSVFRKFLTVEMQLANLFFLSFFLVEISICYEPL